MNEFNPHNYKNYDALPKDHKKEYVRLSKGGFVEKSAKKAYNKFKQQAREANWDRSFKDKILGKGKVNSIDIAHKEAEYKDWSIGWDKMLKRRNKERIEESWRCYYKNLKEVEDGTFIVKKGGLVFRVVGGMTLGSGQKPQIGDHIKNLYATPHPEAIEAIMNYNDKQQYYYDRSSFDSCQSIVVIKVDDFEISKPDITYDSATDTDQVVVSGEVVETLDSQDFFNKYKGGIGSGRYFHL